MTDHSGSGAADEGNWTSPRLWGRSMNRYLLTCMLVGAFAGAAVGLFAVNPGPLAGQNVLRVVLSAAVGAIIGYAASALRPSLTPLHPYARPANRSKSDQANEVD